MDFVCSFFFLVGSRVIFSCGRTCIGGENVKAVTMQNSEHVKTNFRVFGGRFEEQSCCTSCRPLKEDTCVHLKHLSIPNSSWDIVSFRPAGPVDASVEPGNICWYHASLLKITTLVAKWGAELCLTSVLNSALRAGVVQPGYFELWYWKVSRQWGVELLNHHAKSGVKSLSLQACGVREWGVSLVTLFWDSIALSPCWRALSSSADECLRVSGLTIAFAVMKQSAEFQALTYDLIAGFNPVVFLSLILFAQWNSRLVQWIRRCCVGSYALGFDMISVAIESNIRCVLNYWSCAGKPGPLPNWKPISLLFWPRLPWPQRKEEAWRFVIVFRSWRV
jgi:hypothetical protein